jgi:2-polyprenyl-3-methyl-5-hydroxy-6-metoxy-1,4-benzoquinol methylase
MPSTAITKQIEQLGPWFHNIHLPDGEQTAPEHFLGDFPSFKWQQISPYLPRDMTGMQVLDIGCNAGYYSFELARRGAQVTAIDIDEHYLRQARWAAETLDLADRIDFRCAPIYQLVYEPEVYDLVWFMGVMYHLRYPMLALDIVRNCCRGSMIFQTMTSPGDTVFEAEANYDLHQRDIMNHPGWPKMAFIEHQVANDPTNWWAPNHACVGAMLRSAGFCNIQCIAHEIYTCDVTETMPPMAMSELRSVLQSKH